jgi:hypothetical protein
MTCRLADCPRPAIKLGLCNKHYQRVRPARALNPADHLCTIPGCRRRHHARGWCNLHYLRWRNHGSPEAPVQPYRNVHRPSERLDPTVVRCIRLPRPLLARLEHRAALEGVSVPAIIRAAVEGHLSAHDRLTG